MILMRNGLWTAVFLFAWAAFGASAPAQETQVQEEKTYQPEDFFPNLFMELQATPGCLGVEGAKSQTGKDVIFAWFKDKASVLNWYESPLHQKIMGRFFPGRVFRTPLENVPDDSGPIMVVASVTFDGQAKLAGRFPISQIAIELYTPLNGGVFLGGRFAPSRLEVPDMLEYTDNVPKKE